MQKIYQTEFSFYDKIIGMILKQGKKTKTKRFFAQTLLMTSLFLKTPAHLLLMKLFKFLYLPIELKIIQRRKLTRFIPAVVGFKRRVHLVVKLIILGVRSNKDKKSFYENFFKELTNIFKKGKKKSQVLKIQRAKVVAICKNRSHSHYRW